MYVSVVMAPSMQLRHETKRPRATDKERKCKNMLKVIATCHSLLIPQQVQNESSLPAHFLSLPFQFVSCNYGSTSKCKSKPPTDGFQNEGKAYKNFKQLQIIQMLSCTCPLAAVLFLLQSFLVKCDVTGIHVVNSVITSCQHPFNVSQRAGF